MSLFRDIFRGAVNVIFNSHKEEPLWENKTTRENKYFPKAFKESTKRHSIPTSRKQYNEQKEIGNKEYRFSKTDNTKAYDAKKKEWENSTEKPDWDSINSVENYIPFKNGGTWEPRSMAENRVKRQDEKKDKGWDNPDFDTYKSFLDSKKKEQDNFMEQRRDVKPVDDDVESSGLNVLPTLKDKLDLMSGYSTSSKDKDKDEDKAKLDKHKPGRSGARYADTMTTLSKETDEDKKKRSDFYANSKPVQGGIGSRVPGMDKETYDYQLQKKNDSNRTPLGRVFDALMVGTHITAGGAYGAIEQSKDTGSKNPFKAVFSKKAGKGIAEGLKASNPFGKGYEEGAKSFSNVLEVSGWEGKGKVSKISRGTLGFVLDVGLDPSTYLTGGGSAIVKGSGRVGKAVDTTKKAIDKVPMAQFDNKVHELVEKGVNPSLAERFASTQFEKNVINMKDSTHFTNEMAEHIVKNESIKSGKKLTADELAMEGHRLSDQFNKTIGVRDAKGAHDITYGIGNLPFMPKRFQGATVKLGSASATQKFSDATGISTVYQGIRNSAYGSKVGKMLSNNSKLTPLAKESPADFWNGLNHLAHAKRSGYDKMLQKKDIAKFFDEMDLTPAQNKEAVSLMEDKTIANMIDKQIKLGDSEDVQKIRESISQGTLKSKEDLDALLGKNETIKTWERSIDDELLKADNTYQTIKNSYQTELADLDVSSLRGVSEQKKVISAFEQQMQDLKPKIGVESDTDALNALFKGAQEEELARNKFMSQSYNKQPKDGVKLSSETQESMLSGDVIKRMDSAPSRENTIALEEALNSHIYGEADRLQLNSNTSKMLMDKVNEGASKAELQGWIEQRPQFFDSHTREVNKHIAQQMGYKEWNRDGFRHPLAKLRGIDAKESNKMDLGKLEKEVDDMYFDGKFNPREVDEYIGLKQNSMTRNLAQKDLRREGERALLNRRAKESADEFKDIFGASEDEWLNFKRQEFGLDMHDSLTPMQEQLFGKPGIKRGESEYLAHNFAGEFEQIGHNEVAEFMYKHKMVDEIGVKSISEVKSISMEVNKLANEYEGKAFKALHFKDQADIVRHAEYNVKNGKSGLDPEQVMKIAENENMGNQIKIKQDMDVQKANNIKSPKEIFNNSPVAKAQFGRKEEILNNYRQATHQLGKMKDTNTTSRESLIKSYEANLGKQESRIEALEGQKQAYRKAIRDNETGQMAKLKEEIEVNERALKDDEAFESYIDMKTQNDIALIADKEKYAGVIRNETIHNANGLIDLGADGSIVIKKDVEPKQVIDYLTGESRDFNSVQAKEVFDHLKGEGWTKTRVEKMLDSPEKVERFLIEHEKAKSINLADENYFKNGENLLTPDKIEKELDATRSTLEMFETLDVKKLKDGVDPVQAGRFVIEGATEDQKVKDVVNYMREEFMKMGEKEVSIGKLGKEQFEANMLKYLPRVLTEHGEKVFSGKNAKKFDKAIGQLNQDGMGNKFNKFAKERQTKGTVSEVNEYFAEEFPKLLKGNNMFSENVADIYLARAMQHTELMYDNKYMTDMLETLGSEIPITGNISPGKTAVMNHGKMRESFKDITSMRLGTHMSDDVGKYIQHNLYDFNVEAMEKGIKVDDVINQNVSKYLEEAYPDEKMKDLFTDMHNGVLDETGFPMKFFDDEALPMQKLNPKQVDRLNGMWEGTKNKYTNTLEKSLDSALNRSSTDRVAEVLERFNKIGDAQPPQVKQVSNGIVANTNQALKTQRAKDQNAFLNMYDKVHHIFKLQQTTVLPGFHTRNKAGNMFNNWLELGGDAFNKDMQAGMTALARAEGNLEGVAKYVEDGKLGSSYLKKGLDMPDAHPSLSKHLDESGNLDMKELYDLAEAFEVVDTGRFAGDALKGKKSEGLLKFLDKEFSSGKKVSLDPTNTEDFLLYKMGTNFGTPLENGDRLLHFATQLKKGKTLEESAESVRKSLFDYSDITGFEENVMKRVMPYYTWSRKNAKLQVGEIVDKPGKFRDVAKGLNGIEAMANEDDRLEGRFTDDWMKDWIQTPFKDKENEYGDENPMVLSPNLPYLDVNILPDVSNPKRFGREMFSLISPLFKIPIQSSMNYDVFFRNDIAKEAEYFPDGNLKKEADDPVVAKANKALNELPLLEQLQGVSESEDASEAIRLVSNFLTGIKVQPFQYEYNKSKIDGSSMDESKAKQIDELIKGYQKESDYTENDFDLSDEEKKKNTEENQNMIEELEAYLEELKEYEYD